ncbi:MAG: hypothetical protein PHQ93_06240 [Sulfurimonas sp.]|uniref:hypothetical protein n=1 Tax=Sulfurimonas sp. TaxID=2022749 RepID=UPI002636596D|nr:hypothetical protein [Sulfurimonas sp.]MDD5400765.1 hypothetical protein [Sulfurimonas sp.]
MSFRALIFVSYLFFVLNAVADSNTTNRTFVEYIDEKQEKISKKVINIFDGIDRGISRWISSGDEDLYCDEREKKRVDSFFEEQRSIDEFFKGEVYIEESEASFIQVRLGTLFQSKESTSFSPRIRAQIPLIRSQESLQFFVDDINEDDLSKTLPNNKEKGADVGVSYFAPLYKNIRSKYSLGVKGLSAYASARYSKDFKYENWLIKPVQQFKYSSKYDFSEETNIYFDKILNEHSLFRTTLHRKTQASIDGFDYAVIFAYYLALSDRKGFSISQEFWGNSKYVCDAAPERYSGISDYSSSVSWRQDIFRKWITYEIKPSISFHRQYDYEPNYKLGFYVDFYFGNID